MHNFCNSSRLGVKIRKNVKLRMPGIRDVVVLASCAARGRLGAGGGWGGTFFRLQ
jgi:hypothetical protein